MLYGFSIMPLVENEFEARVKDIVDQVKREVVQMPLFIMTLTPEGNPVWDKASKMAKLYARYRDALAKEGVKCGILIQASIGHGYPITKNPFQPLVSLNDGDEKHTCCPMDKDFLAHFSDALRTLAKEKPAVMMLDDDFRLMLRPGRGCACPLHMTEFNRRAGTSMTREELWEYVTTHDKSDELTRIYVSTQTDALVNAAKVFRAAIDEIDPTIQGANCTSGHICEAVDLTSKEFAGKGNPRIVRVPNGKYTPASAREFSNQMRNMAICGARLKKRGVDVILAETDTVPFNRYAKSARYLNAHYIASIMEGASGAKHWLTRTSIFEPATGKAYRDILARHSGLYTRLNELAKNIRWVGLNAYFLEQVDFDFNAPKAINYHNSDWITLNLERMGLPFYFSENSEKANIIEDNMIGDMTDEQIKALFENTVITDGASAKALCERGYGEYLGVDATEWDLGMCHAESFDVENHMNCTKQKNHKKLAVTNDRTEVLSYNVRRADGYQKVLAPATTVLARDNGALSVVFCGSPTATFNYVEGFAFLNETRKKQFVDILSRAGALPIYAVGDEEICLRAGYVEDGRLLAAIYSLGMDPIEKATLYLEKAPSEITALTPDGTEAPVAFEALGEGVYAIDKRVEILEPVLLLIK